MEDSEKHFWDWVSSSRKAIRYESLEASRKQFRLLQVFPGQASDTIRCSLKTFDLAGPTQPRYETISYCWGHNNKVKEIYINHKRVTVPQSCFSALRRVRCTDGPRTVWIDAVCINQRNTRERNSQVGLMKMIYANGVRNIVCLSESCSTPRPILRKIRADAEQSGFLLLKYNSDGSVNRADTDWDNMRSLPDADVLLLTELYKDNWFR